jgi:hypothetical protein
MAVRACLVAIFWPSLFLFWFLAPVMFLPALYGWGDTCAHISSRLDALDAMHKLLPILGVQWLLYALPILCLLLLSRHAPKLAGKQPIMKSIVLFACAFATSAAWAVGGPPNCNGVGQESFSSAWQLTAYLPVVILAVNAPLYVLVIGLGRTFSTRDDAPAVDGDSEVT